jgi:nitrate/nitrite transport system substrate-binding protein
MPARDRRGGSAALFLSRGVMSNVKDRQPTSLPRRRFIATSAAAAAALGGAQALSAVHAAGSDAPEKREVRVGFIPLTDCASVVMAAVNRFDDKHGIRIVLSKEASWAAVRDKLVNGELDAAHALYGLVYGLHVGLGGPQTAMAVLMTINWNGQAISLSRRLAEQGAVDGASLKRVMDRERREYTYAQTFPTGTHAMWLYYWLAANGIHPMNDAKVITVPPPQMVANMRVGNMDGFCVGEPWNDRAIADGVGITALTTQDIWRDHPEKVLGTTAGFVGRHPNTARALTAAVLEASRWIDASLANRLKTAETIAARPYVNTAVDVIGPRMLGRYRNGLGRTWDDPHPMRFFADGAVNFPYLSDGMWFLTQHRRWGLLRQDVDYLAVARRINQVDLYRQAAAAARVSVPREPMRTSRLIDGVVWDGRQPAQYAAGFRIHAMG